MAFYIHMQKQNLDEIHLPKQISPVPLNPGLHSHLNSLDSTIRRQNAFSSHSFWAPLSSQGLVQSSAFVWMYEKMRKTFRIVIQCALSLASKYEAILTHRSQTLGWSIRTTWNTSCLLGFILEGSSFTQWTFVCRSIQIRSYIQMKIMINSDVIHMKCHRSQI